MMNNDRLPRKLHFAMPWGSLINEDGQMVRPDGQWTWANSDTLENFMHPYTSEEVRHVMKIKRIA